ncbi:TIMELESS-interacting protein [Bufo gargarizans]|uniref:TIMELESS-interacting protein n=1 Tax=Bufo gargarizans TaxID=30331 RepID=UPI001CF37C49|nr:TIMELESS-interacting protein [Bufo gargarizans]XP_044139092.1 TIMELESS-interacting protein [Bufo gargarizans]XP_044139093.1 TIMELESS-interacting protein [Bufo gargarizans]
MDRLENDLFDMPDYEHTEDESFPPLPPPRSPGAADDDNEDLANGDDWTRNMGETQSEEAPKPARRVVKRPQPKLDAQRLTSQRGLPALRNLFDGTKFKGKGHEADDLKVLMRQMENWAHRLFPKLQFEDFLSRLETLGNKKEVQTCLKRIRMDLPIVHEDFMSEDVIIQKEEDVPDFASEEFSALTESSPPSVSQSSVVELSEETLQRIERNRRLAMEKRMLKMQVQTDSQALTAPAALSQSSATDPDDILEDFDADLLEEVDKAVEICSQKQEPSSSAVIEEGSAAQNELFIEKLEDSEETGD